MRNLHIQGIILKKQNIGDYDQYITIYSPQIGQFQARAKGARRVKSSFAGHTNLLNICHLQLYKNGDHYTLIQCQATESFREVRENLELSALSFILLELFQKAAHRDEETNKQLFDLFLSTLHSLTVKNRHLLIEAFKIKLLHLSGAISDISECSSCHHRWQSHAKIFTDNEGHLFCRKCTDNSSNTSVPFNIIKLVNFLLHEDYSKIEKIKLQKDEALKLRQLSDMFLHIYINSELKSEKIVNEMTNNEKIMEPNHQFAESS